MTLSVVADLTALSSFSIHISETFGRNPAERKTFQGELRWLDSIRSNHHWTTVLAYWPDKQVVSSSYL